MFPGILTAHWFRSNDSVTGAAYTNTSAIQGIWIVNATATNVNGSVSKEWTWIVNATSSSGAPSITGLPASPATNNAGDSRNFSITANQTVNVSWYLNGTLVQSNTSVTGAAYTNTSAIQGTWIVNATATNVNGSVSKEWTWIVNAPLSPSTLPSPPPSSGGGSSGGGGGGMSGENSLNIEVIEKYDMQISRDVTTSYRFIHEKNPIMSVNITGNTSSGIITTSLEVLKNTSTLVNIPPEGLVYRNLNIWVGTSGFATPKNIKEAVISFRVKTSWVTENDLAPDDIKLLRWNGKEWVTLETSEKGKDSTYNYFEAKTNSFSPFTITGIEKTIPSVVAVTPVPAETAKAVKEVQPEEKKAEPPIQWYFIFSGLLVIGVIKFMHLYKKKK